VDGRRRWRCERDGGGTREKTAEAGRVTAGTNQCGTGPVDDGGRLTEGRDYGRGLLRLRHNPTAHTDSVGARHSAFESAETRSKNSEVGPRHQTKCQPCDGPDSDSDKDDDDDNNNDNKGGWTRSTRLQLRPAFALMHLRTKKKRLQNWPQIMHGQFAPTQGAAAVTACRAVASRVPKATGGLDLWCRHRGAEQGPSRIPHRPVLLTQRCTIENSGLWEEGNSAEKK